MSNIEALRGAESIKLWISNESAEQILLAWAVWFLGVIGVDQSRLQVLQFTPPNPRFEFFSLGMLNPEQICAHPPPQTLDPESVLELRDAWHAITSPDPEVLLGFLSKPLASFPFLVPSVRALLDRYPHHRVGLNRAELTLLKCVQEHGPRASAVVGHTIISNSGHDFWGDGWLFSRLLYLGRTSHAAPAVVLAGDTTHMHTCEAQLTPTGSQLLAGAANFIDLNGIDDWVLGVHLSSDRGSVWLREGDTSSAKARVSGLTRRCS